MNIKIFRNEKMRMDPVPSLSQHVHGVEIKLEQTDVSDNSDINLVYPLPGTQTDSLSLSTECSTSIGEPVAKKQRLSESEIENIIMGAELSDLHINLAQRVIKEQFPHINGLESILLQSKQHTLTEDMVKNKLQIIHYLQ